MMIRPSVDAKRLSSIPVLNVSSYLLGLGWRSEEVPGGTLWSLDSEVGEAGGAELFVPASESMHGYAGVLSDAVDIMSEVEDRERDLVIQSLTFATSDVQFVRIFSGTETGTTPINDGASLYANLRAWVLASAVSVAGTKASAIQPARKPQRAIDFLRDVKVGPSRPGSYVVSVIMPIPPAIPSSSADVDNPVFSAVGEPFARQVSLSLQSSTESAHRLARRVTQGRGDFADFRVAVEEGMSSNFCFALAGLAGEDGSDFSVDFTWSPARPVEKHPAIRFNGSQLSVLSEAAYMLREAEPEEDVHFVGNVVRLHHEGNLGSGDASILGSVEGDDDQRARRVWLSLSEADYALAATAHRDGNLVSVHGSLLRRGNRTNLIGARDFTVLPVDD